MPISNIVVRGYGSFGGGVNKLPTRGYGISVPAVPPRFTSTIDFSYLILDEFNVGDLTYLIRGPLYVSEDTRLFFVGDIKAFEIQNITKDGIPWAITGATLYLVNPSGTVTPYTATQVDSVTWRYITTSLDLGTAGWWRRYWLVTDGSSPNKWGEKSFQVLSVA